MLPKEQVNQKGFHFYISFNTFVMGIFFPTSAEKIVLKILMLESVTVIESQHGLSWKEHLKIIYLVVIGRDTSHKIRFLKVQSSLTLNTPNDGASTTILGNMFQCFTTLFI